MPLRRLSETDLLTLSERYHLQLTEEELEDYFILVNASLSAYDALEQMPDPELSPIPAQRTVGQRPSPATDPLNAIVRSCQVKSDHQGPLSGRSIGLKDNVCIAGIPMTCGSRLLYDFVPDLDATIVTRILKAGGEITAILNADDFGFSGAGHTSAYGPTLNPHNPEHLAGGSACGSAAAVGSNLVDMKDHYHGVFYARAQNLSRAITQTYTQVLRQYDLLVMPTTPQTAHKLPPSPVEDRKTHIAQALNMVQNTCAFNLTGHPSISIPCGQHQGLPIGLMITGRHFDDATVLRAAHAYQQST